MAKPAELNLDTAFTLDLRNVYEGRYFKVAFEKFKDDEVTPDDWEDKPYTFVISATDGGAPLITLNAGAISLSGNLLTVECTDDKNLMQAAKVQKYYYNLLKQVETNRTEIEGKGTIYVNPAII